MKRLIHLYRSRIRKNCIDITEPDTDRLEYWQDSLFATTMEFVIPLSMISVIPGVYFCLINDLPVLAALDFISFLWLVYVGLGPVRTVLTRKLLFIFCVYFVSSYLLLYIGVVGPGMIFFFASAVFALVILPVKYAYWWSWINLAACIVFALVVHFDLSPTAAVNQTDAAQWIAISSNLVFLSFTFSLLMPRLINGLSGSFRKQKNLQLDLSEKNSDLEQYASIISHDLQTPLRTINGFLSLLEKKYGTGLDDKGREYIHFAVDGAVHMQQIINALLEFSRAGKYESGQFERFSLDEVLSRILHILSNQVEEKQARVTCEPGIFIVTNKPAFTQVLHNLVANALKYSKPDTPACVDISVEEIAGEWQFRVKDNGIGIEEEYFDKIFIIFQRLHTRSQFEGTGIGLAIVKRIVEKLNGRVWVKSAPGTGSTFYFTIPQPKN